jgi:four helix bundle protein
MERQRSQSIVQEKSFAFAVNLIHYAQRQAPHPMTAILVRQLLRSGTSIGANVEEALGGQSRKDFVAKLAIAAKEARETTYWLRLITKTQSRESHDLARLLTECGELVKMLNSIILTTRSKRNDLNPEQNQKRSYSLNNSELITQNSELPVP